MVLLSFSRGAVLAALTLVLTAVLLSPAAISAQQVCDGSAAPDGQDQELSQCQQFLIQNRTLTTIEGVGQYFEGQPWNELTDPVQQHLRGIGYTSTMWNGGYDPYFFFDWDEMRPDWKQAMETLGWTGEAWMSTDVDPTYRPLAEKTPWDKLTPQQQEAALVLGYNALEWISGDWGKEFNPIMIQLSIPELQKLDMDYLASLDVQVELRDGDTVGEDEYFRAKMHMREYIQALQNGSKLYLKYEDHDTFKQHIRREVGQKVFTHMGEALRNSVLREQGHFKPEYDLIEYSDYNWLIWVGGTNTTTSMHYDDDTFNFLWVMQGRKRVVLIPNDERTADTYDCTIAINDGDHSCWTGIDILNGDLPEHAIEIEVGPGDGILIPHLSWHAVQNLEPTIAYGFRVDLDQDEQAALAAKAAALAKQKDEDEDDDEEDEDEEDEEEEDDEEEDDEEEED